MKVRIKYLTILLFSVTVIINANADNILDVISPDEQYQKAKLLYNIKDYEGAFIAFEKAANLYKLNPNWEYQTDIYNYLSGLSWKYRNLADASAYCDSVFILLLENKVDSLHQQMAKGYHNYATIELLKGHLKSSVVYYKKAIAINERAANPMETSLITNYSNISISYSYMNNSHMAIVYATKSLDLDLKYNANDSYKIGQGYQNLGLAYTKAYKYKIAEEKYRKALENYGKVLNEPHLTLGQMYINLAVIATSDSNYLEAIKYNNRALYNFGSNTATPHADSYKLLHNNAAIYKMMGEYDKAIEFESRSIEYWIKQGFTKHPFLANSYEYMGRIYNEKQEYDSALIFLQKALVANIYHFNDTSLSSIPILEEILSKFYLGVTFIWKAEVLVNKYNITKDTSLLYMAAENYYLYSGVVSLFMEELDQDESILSIYHDYIPAYENALFFCYNAYSETNDEKFLNDAFYFSEKTNALLLKATLNSEDAISFADIPDDLVKNDKKLKETLLEFENKYNNIVTTIPFDSVLAATYLNDSIFYTKVEIDELNVFLKENYPQYFQLKHSDKLITADEIRSTKLTEQDAMIEYFFGDTILYVITLTNNEIALDTININQHFLDEIDDFRKSTSNYSFIQLSPVIAKKTLINAGIDLYSKLFPKSCREIIASKSNLIIIPDDILSYIPFDALITKTIPDENKSYSNLNYLIYDYSIVYAYSASIMANKQCNATSETYYVGYAPNYDTLLLAKAAELDAFELFRSSPTALTGNVNEVQNVGKLLDGDTYIGNEAGEKNFKENTQDYSIIHLAMHALINDKNPLSSTLIFTNTSDSVEDDYLHTYEIYGLKLNADLAVLSACNTGNGSMQTGEGIMSLGRAFTYAGVSNMVSTLWSANDATSNLLMVGFFEEIKKGAPIADALRRSKINYLKTADPVFANPYYWANFILVGNNEVIFTNQQSLIKENWLWLVLILFLLTILTWRIAKSYKKYANAKT